VSQPEDFDTQYDEEVNLVSQPQSELNIINSFRELLDYITVLGEHINQIYDHLETIEKEITEVKNELGSSLSENKTEIENIRQTMITRAEFNDMLMKLYKPFEKFSPPKAPKRARN